MRSRGGQQDPRYQADTSGEAGRVSVSPTRSELFSGLDDYVNGQRIARPRFLKLTLDRFGSVEWYLAFAERGTVKC